MILILLALQDDLVEKWLAAAEADRPAIEEKLGKDALPAIEKAAKTKPEAKKLRTRVLLRAVVAPWLEKEYPDLMKAKDAWKKMSVEPFEAEHLAKMLPDRTIFGAAVGHVYPVARVPVHRSYVIVKNDGTDLVELVRMGTKPGDPAAVLGPLLAGAKSDVAAAALLLWPPCTCQFGRAWIGPGDLAGTKISNAKIPVKGEVELDGKGRVKKIAAECHNMHPICIYHLAAARDFARGRVGDLVLSPLVERLLPDAYLYEVVEDGRVVGFVRVRKKLMECRTIDRVTLDGLPRELYGFLRGSSSSRR